MDENSRLSRRTRNRPPYDLRRKVLLKNFLREQITITPVQTPSNPPTNIENQLVETQSSSEILEVDVENLDRSNLEQNIPNFTSPDDHLQECENEEEEGRGTKHHPDSPWKSTLIFDFSKIAELKLSRLNPLKRKSTPLTTEEVKLITGAQSSSEVATQTEEPFDENMPYPKLDRNQSKTSDLEDLPKHNNIMTKLSDELKKKVKRHHKKKRGVLKAKDVLKSNKVPFKQKQVDLMKNERKSQMERLRNQIGKVISDVKGLVRIKKSTECKEKESLKEDSSYSLGEKNEPEVICEVNSKHDQSSVNKSSNTSTYIWQDNAENEENKFIKVDKTWKAKGKLLLAYHVGEEEDRVSAKIDKSSPEWDSKRFYDGNSNATTISQKGRTCTNTSSQSLPIDINWSLHEIRKLERANKRLREENKLLSESLSSIMADVDLAFSPHRIPAVTSPQNSHIHLKNTPAHAKTRSSRIDQEFRNKSLRYKPAQQQERMEKDYICEQSSKINDGFSCRVLRSKSVQEKEGRKREIKLRLSSRSMCHRQYVRISPKTLYKAKPCIITSHSSDKVLPIYCPDPPPILPHTKLNRRLSMPEKKHQRPLVSRRGSSANEQHTARNRYNPLSLPNDAFY